MNFNPIPQPEAILDDMPDTPPGHYHSLFVAREADHRQMLAEFEGAHLAFNEAASHSGWATAAFAPVRFRLGPETGSDRESVRAIADGRAEIAAIDAISWRLLVAHTGLTGGLKIVDRSPASPGQALITAFPAAAAALRSAISEGINHLAPEHRSALGMTEFVALTPEAYLAVPNPPTPEAYAAPGP